jgi:hypothetical protein
VQDDRYEVTADTVAEAEKAVDKAKADLRKAKNRLERVKQRNSRREGLLRDFVTVRFDRYGCTYAAIRVGEKWYLTGRIGSRPMSDQEFLQFVDQTQVKILAMRAVV